MLPLAPKPVRAPADVDMSFLPEAGRELERCKKAEGAGEIGPGIDADQHGWFLSEQNSLWRFDDHA